MRPLIIKEELTFASFIFQQKGSREGGNRNGRAENNFLPIPPMKGPFIDAHGGAVVGFKVPAQCSLARSLLWKQESVEMQRTSERARERAAVAPGRPSVRPSLSADSIDLSSCPSPFTLHRE